MSWPPTYPKLNQVIAITIVDFIRFREFEHYLSCHEFRETISNNCYLDEIRHYFIELPKFTKTETELESAIDKWCYFLKHAGRLEMIPEKLNHEPFRKAFEIANRANMTKEEWEAYDATSVRMQDERGIAIAARKEGLQEGEQIGQQRILRALQQKGLGKEQLADMTGIALEEINRLLD